jgi:hypothetical protein
MLQKALGPEKGALYSEVASDVALCGPLSLWAASEWEAQARTICMCMMWTVTAACHLCLTQTLLVTQQLPVVITLHSLD